MRLAGVHGDLDRRTIRVSKAWKRNGEDDQTEGGRTPEGHRPGEVNCPTVSSSPNGRSARNPRRVRVKPGSKEKRARKRVPGLLAEVDQLCLAGFEMRLCLFPW